MDPGREQDRVARGGPGMTSRTFVVTLTIEAPVTTRREAVEHLVAEFVQRLGSWTGRVVAVEEFHGWARRRGDAGGVGAAGDEPDQRAS